MAMKSRKKTDPVDAEQLYEHLQAVIRDSEALLKAGVPVEMHIFAHGAHGSGLGMGNATLDQWPGLLESWLRERGLLTRDEAALAK